MKLAAINYQPAPQKKVGAQAGDQSAYQKRGTDGGRQDASRGDWRRGNSSGFGYPCAERSIRPKTYNQGKPLRNTTTQARVGFL